MLIEIAQLGTVILTCGNKQPGPGLFTWSAFTLEDFIRKSRLSSPRATSPLHLRNTSCISGPATCLSHEREESEKRMESASNMTA